MSTTYQVNWNYRPADEGINTQIANNITPIVDFLKSSYNDALVFNDITYGNGYIDSNNQIQDGQWHVAVVSVLANGGTREISSLSPKYGVRAQSNGSVYGYVYSDWQATKPPEYNGTLNGVKYAIAYPGALLLKVKNLPEYRTEFGTDEYVDVNPGYVHVPLYSELDLTNIRVRAVDYYWNGYDLSNIITGSNLNMNKVQWENTYNDYGLAQNIPNQKVCIT